MYFLWSKCFFDWHTLLSNVMPCDVKHVWQVPGVRVWGQWQSQKGWHCYLRRDNLQSVIACFIESSAFVTITVLFHCLYKKISFMYKIRPVLAPTVSAQSGLYRTKCNQYTGHYLFFWQWLNHMCMLCGNNMVEFDAFESKPMALLGVS